MEIKLIYDNGTLSHNFAFTPEEYENWIESDEFYDNSCDGLEFDFISDLEEKYDKILDGVDFEDDTIFLSVENCRDMVIANKILQELVSFYNENL